MKFKRSIFIALLFILCSCKITFVKNSSSSNNSSFSSINTSNDEIISSSSDLINSSSSSNIINSSSYNSSSNIISSSSSDNIKLYSKILNTSVDVGEYYDNWGNVTIDNIKYEYYRANYSEGLISLNYLSSPYKDALGGMFYNVSPIYGIRKVEIVYKTNKCKNNPVFKFGINSLVENEINLPISNEEYNVYNFEISYSNFFKICTLDNILDIKSLTINYSNIKENYSNNYLSSGDGDFRLNPVVFEGDLIDGVSSVNVPINVIKEGNNYKIIETKKYVYYSYNYISRNKSLASEASLTSPLDVSNYFIAFKTYPCNYVLSKKYNTAYKIFGDLTRCVSIYSREDGYAKSVPYQENYSTGEVKYYECDIALDSKYKSSNRGVGRLVVWFYVFAKNKGAIGYDDSIVTTYTDDHYQSFFEYLNTGKFSKNFNAETNCTNYKWGAPITLN